MPACLLGAGATCPADWEHNLVHWNLAVTLTLPRCCECLRISQQFFFLFLEASSNIVPLGATKRPFASQQFWSKDDGLPFLDLVCFIDWFPAWVRTLISTSLSPDEVWWRTGLSVRLPCLATLWPAQLVEVPFSSVTCWDVPLVWFF